MHEILRNKRVISFDGDGTLWYPKETKRTISPWSIYERYPEEYLRYLELTPGAFELLKFLEKQKNKKVAIISTHPHPFLEAYKILQEKVAYFHLETFYDFLSPAPDVPEGKGVILKKYVEDLDLNVRDAIHIGDSIQYDYEAMKNVGIELILLNAPYNTKAISAVRVDTLEDLL